MTVLVWSIGLAFLGGAFAAWAGLLWSRRRQAQAWPHEWSISARPIFTAHERVLHRQLTSTLPDHVVLAKLPLLRFCQAVTLEQGPYWYEMLGPLYVSFAICNPGGRVLVAIDVEAEGADSRASRLKGAALQACRIRHVRLRPDMLPSPADVLAWVGDLGAAQRAAQAEAARLERAGEQLAQTVRKRRAERQSQWQDSFFAPDSRFDDLIASRPMSSLLDDPPGRADAEPRPSGGASRLEAPAGPRADPKLDADLRPRPGPS